MKRTNIDKINKKEILDIMYEPYKNTYSILEKNSTRKQITRKEFFSLVKQLRNQNG